MPRLGTSGGPGPAWLRWITRGSLVLGGVALVLTVSTVGVDTLGTHLATIGPWFGLLLAIEAIATFCDAGAVYLLARGPGAPSYRAVCVAQFAGRAVNSVTPGGNLGEALKVSVLARRCSMPRIVAAVMFATLYAFVISLAIIAVGSIATAIVFALPAAAAVALVVAGIVVGGVAVGLVVLLRRGMLCSLARAGRRLHLISAARHDRWYADLENVDARLRGELGEGHRRGAIALLVLAQLLLRVVIGVTILATGYALGGAQLVAVLSAGIFLTWIANLVPMGVGLAEGGNGVLFAVIGAPASIGVALALARRVNQIVFAVLGFAVLAADRIANRVEAELPALAPASHPQVVPTT